jgi:hypothetical protein
MKVIFLLKSNHHMCSRNMLVVENCALLRSYAACSDNFLPTCREKSFLDSLPLKMGPIGCPETSVRTYQYMLCISLEERSSHLLRGGILKSRTSVITV